VHGAVIWYHPDLRCALIERIGGLTLGTLDKGRLDLFHSVWGDLASTGLKTLTNRSTGRDVVFTVEAVALSEDQANELLGLQQS